MAIGGDGVLPRLALATAFAVGLCVPALGVAPPDSCVLGPGVAGAAPSPSCGGDLRECLRTSADMHQTTFGGRYVTAEDVSRCVEAFNACTHGGASLGGNQSPPMSTSAQGDSRQGLPQRFRITYQSTAIDCRTTGVEASCSSRREEQLPAGGTYSETGEIDGTVSGMTLSGTVTRHGRSAGDSSGCVSEQTQTGPVRYEFTSDGAVAMNDGPITQDIVFSGTCADSPRTSSSFPVWQATATWSPVP